MDAKSKANFINSVASGAVVPCPACGASNKPDGRFCISCGTELAARREEAQSNAQAAPAFEPAKESAPAFEPAKESAPAFEAAKENAPAFEAAKETVSVAGPKYVEPSNVFAQGLPEWSIEPPQVMVRRH